LLEKKICIALTQLVFLGLAFRWADIQVEYLSCEYLNSKHFKHIFITVFFQLLTHNFAN